MEQPAERAKNDAKEEKARQARQALIDALLSSIVHPEGVIDPAKMAPQGELVGLAHAFLPSDSDGFATEILKKASDDDDSFLVIKV